MFNLERLLSIDKNNMTVESKLINNDELPQLIEWLSEKDDTIRYQSFLLIQNRSIFFDDVYTYWETFCEKLNLRIRTYF